MSDLKRSSPFDKSKMNNRFEPSSDTKIKWLLTRKKRYGKGSVSLPGLFTTEKYNSDTLFFVTAIIAEIFGLYVIWQASGFSRVFIWLVVGAFVVDLACAIALHWFEGDKTLYENELHKFENNKESGLNSWDIDSRMPKKKTKWKVLKFLAILLLSVLAVGKILLFYYLPPQQIDGITIGICLSYLYVAYVHFYHTGYFLSEVMLRVFFINSDYRKFNKLKNKSENKYFIPEYRRYVFSSDVNLIELSVDNGRHHLEAIDPKLNSDNNYQFRTWGILTDQDLVTFIDAQETAGAASEVSKYGHNLQMEILMRDTQKKTDKSRPSSGTGLPPANPPIPDKPDEANKLSTRVNADIKNLEDNFNTKEE